MFYSNEHYMSISHMAIFVYMATQQDNVDIFSLGLILNSFIEISNVFCF